jgi:acyl-ACP thioesterase
MSPEPDPPDVWTEGFRVRAYEADPDGLAPAATLVDYFQEAAGNHASSVDLERGPSLLPDRYGVWVLTQLQLDVDRRPAWREAVTLATWASGRDKLYAWRDFEMTGDDGPIARGTSRWLVLDAERRRPVRLPGTVERLPLADRPAALAREDLALSPPEGVAHTDRRRVRLSDLDQNAHANNARYLVWALDALPDPPGALAGFALLFKAEAVLGDEIVSESGALSDGRIRHAIRHADGRVLALVETRWTG